MSDISKQQYEFALNRVEHLLPLVKEDDISSPEAVELQLMSDVVIEYEKLHFPIEKLTVGELIALALEDANMTQKQLAALIGISSSRISDYVGGRSEPTLRIAGSICRILHIAPSAMMQASFLASRV